MLFLCNLLKMRQKITMKYKCTCHIVNNFKKILFVLAVILSIMFAITIVIDITNLGKNPLSSNTSSNDIDFFAITLTMDAIIVAIVVFLYSHYKEEVFGVPTEFIVKCIMGDSYITLYKIAIFIIPCISFLCKIKGFRYVGFACVISMYTIVGVFSYLTTSIMRRDVIKSVIHKELSDEIENRTKIFQSSKILTLTVDGYRKEKVIQRDRSFYGQLRSELIEMVFQAQSSRQELAEIIEELFNTIVHHKNKCSIIGFVFAYDLALGILNMDMKEESYYYWNLKLLERLVYTLDQELYQLKERENKFKDENYYLDIYIAFIYALIITKDKVAEKFLWRDFYVNSKQRDKELTKKMFVATVLYMQVLLVKKYENFDLFFELVKKNTDSFRRAFIDYKSMLNLKKYGFLISFIGVCSLSEAVAILEAVEEDLNHVCEKGYIPNTIFLSFLNRKEN